MSFEDVSKVYELIQAKRAESLDLNFESLSLPAYILEGIPTTEARGGASLFGFPIRAAEWMPEGMGMATTKCLCTTLERMQPNHITKHVVILDFRTDEQKRADAEKFKAGEYEA